MLITDKHWGEDAKRSKLDTCLVLRELVNKEREVA